MLWVIDYTKNPTLCWNQIWFLNGLFEYLKLIFFPKLIQFHPIWPSWWDVVCFDPLSHNLFINDGLLKNGYALIFHYPHFDKTWFSEWALCLELSCPGQLLSLYTPALDPCSRLLIKHVSITFKPAISIERFRDKILVCNRRLSNIHVNRSFGNHSKKKDCATSGAR